MACSNFKWLFKVSITYNSVTADFYIYASSSCVAVNKTIAYVHESMDVPLSQIDSSSIQCVPVLNFIK